MRKHAYLFIIAAAGLWGLIGLFVRSLNAAGFTALHIVMLRTIVSAAGITLLFFKYGFQHTRINWRDSWMFIGTGILSLTFFNYCYFNSIQLTSLAVAALLLYTAPIFVMLMSVIFFGEKFTPLKGVALLCTFIGCACVTGALEGELNLSLTGLLYGLGSGFGYALYSIFGKYAVEKKYSSLTISAYTFYFAFLAAIPLVRPDSAFFAKITLETIPAILGLGIVAAVIPYILYTQGLKSVEPGKASIIATFEPVVASLVGVFAFAEPLTLAKLTGMALILSSVVLLNMPRGKGA